MVEKQQSNKQEKEKTYKTFDINSNEVDVWVNIVDIKSTEFQPLEMFDPCRIVDKEEVEHEQILADNEFKYASSCVVNKNINLCKDLEELEASSNIKANTPKEVRYIEIARMVYNDIELGMLSTQKIADATLFDIVLERAVEMLKIEEENEIYVKMEIITNMPKAKNIDDLKKNLEKELASSAEDTFIEI